MIYRIAVPADIEQLHVVRMAVKENVLNTPGLVTTADYEKYLTRSGKGWLAEGDGKVTGFAIVDTDTKNIWALFVHPQFEAQGIGKRLQQIMLNWYFEHYNEVVWLSTAPGTRAERFYEMSGWQKTGTTKGGETRFELSKASRLPKT